jgi:hypothetical protein
MATSRNWHGAIVGRCQCFGERYCLHLFPRSHDFEMALMYLNCSIKERRKRNSMSYANLVLGRAVAPWHFKHYYLTNFMQLLRVTSRQAKDTGVMTKKKHNKHMRQIYNIDKVTYRILLVFLHFSILIFSQFHLSKQSAATYTTIIT